MNSVINYAQRLVYAK